MPNTDVSPVSWALNATYPHTTHGGTNRVSASFDLMEALIAGATLPDVLKLVAERARSMAGARLAFLAMPAAEAHKLTVVLAVGDEADRVLGLTVRNSGSVLGRVFTSRRAMSTRVAGSTSRVAGAAPDAGLPTGPILLLPLDTGEATRGVLAVVGRQTDLPFSNSVCRQLTGFSAMAASLVELGEERRAELASSWAR